MSQFKNIEKKLHQFTKKYYINELIKGSILFFSFGVLYFLFTLFVEYFLWLKPSYRTLLFWGFVLVELFLIIRFIGIPIFKILGLQKGISLEESSKIIGNHFPDVKDKLLNVLQLKQSNYQSDLLLASINQKAKELQPIPFVKAINFKKNSKYLKYAVIPIIIWLLTLFTGNNGIFKQSLERVVNYNTAYIPPAPFVFSLKTNNLKVIQGKALKVVFSVEGNTIPNEAIIVFNDEQYFLENFGNGRFEYTFLEVQKPFSFHVEGNSISSKDYDVEVIKTPTINSITMQLNYPKYLKRKKEIIKNSGNITVPEGTNINWLTNTNQTKEVAFLYEDKREVFKEIDENTFKFSKQIVKPTNYKIASSNTNLKDFETLSFSIATIKDEFPSINVSSNIDSISRGTASFVGQISDDYGLTKLEFVYYNKETPKEQNRVPLIIQKNTIETFFYDFPNKKTNLKEGVSYEMFFQVYDNDGVNGNKKVKSKVFSYKQKTENEIEKELLNEQKSTINSLENVFKKQQKEQEKLQEIQNELQHKKNANWNDRKKLENLVKRQQQYNNIMQRQSDKLKENLLEKDEKDSFLKEKKKDLQKRIEELKKTDKQEKLLNEIQKIAEKLNKEDLVKKAKHLAQQNKQKERSLTRTLELVKRFYVEQKTMQIANKLDELAKEQKKLAGNEDNSLDKQKDLSNQFEDLKKDLDQLSKDNEALKEPMELPDVDEEKEVIDKEQKESEDNLQNQNKKQAQKSQKQAANKMQQMSKKMQQSMLEMQGDSVEENIEDLRKILENLITFSYQQEDLMDSFSEITTTHPVFGDLLKSQNTIKTYFEHIDDSLYVLSMRLPKLSSKIQTDLSDAHYNLDQSLENFSENRFDNGLSNQRYTITAANNLADYLSSMLTNMKNSMSMSSGKGKKSSPGFSLPDIIKKQGDLSKKMKSGMQKPGKKGESKKGEQSNSKPGDSKKQGKDGEKDGEGGSKSGNSSGKNESEGLNGELFEIYKQQSLLRQQLEEQLNNKQGEGLLFNKEARKVLKTMEELENEILEKGFTQEIISKMQQLNYELLKLEKAELQQGKDKKRKSSSNFNQYQKNSVKALQLKKQYYNQLEILNRQSLPLQQNYKEKVREYFTKESNK